MKSTKNFAYLIPQVLEFEKSFTVNILIFKTFLSLDTLLNSVDIVRHTYNDDTLLIEGNFVNTSYIKNLVNNRPIPKIYVYVVNTFYILEDLELHGVKELQIFANTWHISRQVTFDLSGSDGKYQAPSTVNGSAGNPGNAGMNGGNFLGLANEVMNGDFLTVNLSGGNGGDGQDGTASDDVQVTFNASVTDDSGWFSSADLRTYSQHYFKERGYEPEINYVGDYTSFYALLVHNKQAAFPMRLHKCCGTTGLGGSGGLGGRSGRYIFKKIGNGNVNGFLRIVTKDGLSGNSGRDAKPCESDALDILVATRLEKVVFICLPIHHTVTSDFLIGKDHVDSTKCTTKYLRGKEPHLESEEQIIDTLLAISQYKAFLEEQMKNKLLEKTIQRIINAIDSDSEINMLESKIAPPPIL